MESIVGATVAGLVVHAGFLVEIVVRAAPRFASIEMLSNFPEESLELGFKKLRCGRQLAFTSHVPDLYVIVIDEYFVRERHVCAGCDPWRR